MSLQVAKRPADWFAIGALHEIQQPRASGRGRGMRIP
jgi:hypothetical protein